MNEVQIINYIYYAQSVKRESLKASILEHAHFIQGNLEMAESAQYHRNEASNQHLAGYEDYEHEAEEAQQAIEILSAVEEMHHRLDIEGLKYVKDTLQFIKERKNFICKATSRHAIWCAMYLNGRMMLIPLDMYHDVRRYFENHAEDYTI